jgi:hypothetical protein
MQEYPPLPVLDDLLFQNVQPRVRRRNVCSNLEPNKTGAAALTKANALLKRQPLQFRYY